MAGLTDTLEEVVGPLIAGLRAQLPPGFDLAGIEVHLGEQVDLLPEALRAALVARLPGIEVRVTVVASLLRCDDCGAEYPPDEFPCPVCGSARASLVHGHELAIARAWGSDRATTGSAVV